MSFPNEIFEFDHKFYFRERCWKRRSGSTTFDLSNQLMFMDVIDEYNFGVLGFSEFGQLSNFNTFGTQEHLYGVQLETDFDFSSFEYELSLAYLHGLTDASTNHMFLWNMEIEF